MNGLEKALAAAAGLSSVGPGMEIDVPVDLILAHDGSAPAVIEEFERSGHNAVAAPERVVLTFDHYLPPPHAAARRSHRRILGFCGRHGISPFHRGQGVLHQVVAERFRPRPGQIIAGADGHVSTAGAFGALAFSLKPAELAGVLATGRFGLTVPPSVAIAVEGELRPGTGARDLAIHMLGAFGPRGLEGRAAVLRGSTLGRLGPEDRMTVANLLAETGAVTAWFGGPQEGDYTAVYRLDASSIEPCLACPPPTGGVRPARELAGTPVSVVFIGGCGSGRLSDLALVSSILESRDVHRNVTLVVTPASARVAAEAERRGFAAIIRAGGGIITPPGCGPCGGTHLGVVAEGDTVLATVPRNVPGRMGDPGAEVYLSSPGVAAWSAVHGEIRTPE